MVDENLISTWHYLRHILRISGTADAEVVCIKSLITRATILGTGYNTYLHPPTNVHNLKLCFPKSDFCKHFTSKQLVHEQSAQSTDIIDI